MPANVSAHPSDDDLIAFGNGRIDPAAESRIADHLAGCPDCMAKVKDVSADSLLRRVRWAAKGKGDTAARLNESETDRIRPEPTVYPSGTGSYHPAGDELPQFADYDTLELLGKGGMGAVYRVRNKLSGREEAVKVIHPHMAQDPEISRRFRTEIEAASRLRHPHIVAVNHAFTTADGGLAYTMELVRGTNLMDRVRDTAGLPVAEACESVRQAAAGLHFAHDAGLIHRDVKPHNLMRDEGITPPAIKVADFGLVKRIDGEKTSGAGGTPAYVSPEQAFRPGEVDHRADIYSLGCTLFCLLTGKAPFAHHTDALPMILAHKEEPPPDVRRLRPKVPAGLAELVDRMLAKDPADRPQSMTEVMDALAPYCDGAVMREREPRSKWPLIAAAAALVAAVAVVVGVLVLKPKSADRTPVAVAGDPVAAGTPDETVTENRVKLDYPKTEGPKPPDELPFSFAGKWRVSRSDGGQSKMPCEVIDSVIRTGRQDDDNATELTWKRQDGTIVVTYPNGSKVHLAINPANPNLLEGSMTANGQMNGTRFYWDRITKENSWPVRSVPVGGVMHEFGAVGIPKMSWTIKGGVVEGQNVNEKAEHFGWLVSRPTYQNLRLQFEANGGGRDSLVAVRLTGPTRDTLTGYGVVIQGGKLFGKLPTGSIVRIEKGIPDKVLSQPGTPSQPGKQTVEVIVAGSEIRTLVNGQRAASVPITPSGSGREGMIGVWVPYKSVLKLKDFMADRLPDDPAK